MKSDVHAWFMSYNGMTKNGIRLTVKQEYGKKAYLGEYRWGNNEGINTRWDIDCHPNAQFYKDYKYKRDVDSLVEEGFNYCIQTIKHLGKDLC